MFIGGLNWETTDGMLLFHLSYSDGISNIYPISHKSHFFFPFFRGKFHCITDISHTVESLKNYFSQFGEVTECTVMRDGTTGRSRGFGFLTFKDPKTVNIVMVKEHYLDGKIVSAKF